MFVFEMVMEFLLGLGMKLDIFWVSSMLEAGEIVGGFGHPVKTCCCIIVNDNYMHL